MSCFARQILFLRQVEPWPKRTYGDDSPCVVTTDVAGVSPGTPADKLTSAVQCPLQSHDSSISTSRENDCPFSWARISLCVSSVKMWRVYTMPTCWAKFKKKHTPKLVKMQLCTKRAGMESVYLGPIRWEIALSKWTFKTNNKPSKYKSASHYSYVLVTRKHLSDKIFLPTKRDYALPPTTPLPTFILTFKCLV